MNGGYGNDRNYTPTNERIFPTTPSTFPHSVYPSSQAGNGYVSPPVQSPFGGQGGGYFPTAGYQAQHSQPQSPYQQTQFQNQYQPQYQQQNLATPQPSHQQRQGGYNANDPTSGLARQFSNQNLGAPQRQPSPFARQASPNSRFHQNGQQNQGQQTRNQQSYTSNYNAPASLLTPSMSNGSMNSSNQNLSSSVEEPPEKNPEKFSANVIKRGQGLHGMVETFFKENIARARDRNMR